MSWFEAATRWYLVLVLATWAIAPLVRLLCDRLPDRGALVARPLALLGVVYPSWLLSSLGLLPYSTLGLWLTVGVTGAVAWTIVLRRGTVDRGWLRALLVAEGMSLAAFAAYLWLRGFTPDILGTEKPMDAAFLAASARATTMPPPDPWFAGEPINYYYLGYLLHGAVARLAGVAATTGFNLALATTFSAAATAAAGVGFNAARPWLSRRLAVASGLLAAMLLVGVGNLYAAVRLLQTPAATLAADWWDKRVGVGWRASRIVCDGERVDNDCASGIETINEFPFFSFLLGDLHPHVTALPVAVAALALALNLALRGRDPAPMSRPTELAVVGVSGAVAGSLYALNSWDFPTYLTVTAGALLIGPVRVASGRTAARVAVLGAGAVGAWLPFFLGFVPPTGSAIADLPALVRNVPVLPGLLTGVALHGGERTSIGEFLTIFGVPYAAGIWIIGTGMARGRHELPLADVRAPVLVGGIGALALAVLLEAPVLVLCGLPLVGAILLLRRGGGASARTVATGLFAVGLALTITVEIVYVRDVFDSRMNTLFKIYYQVWTLFAVATALSAVVLWREASPRFGTRPVLTLLGVVALAAGAVYPALASYRWTGGFAGWDGLDGIAYVGLSDPDELAAIRWLQANAGEEDVLLEAAGCAYRPPAGTPFNRASAFSGVPTVIGWANHERQWRSGRADWLVAIEARGEDVAEGFAEPAGEVLERHRVTLLFVGRQERELVDRGCTVAGPYPAVEEEGYPGPGWDLAFGQGEIRIFRRTGTEGGLAGRWG